MIAAFLNERDERRHASVLHKLRIFDSTKFGQGSIDLKKLRPVVFHSYRGTGTAAPR